MKRTISVVLGATLLIATASPAFAWGSDGHQTVGKIASLRIKRRTAQKIAQILQPGESLASISTWADSVKERMGQTDPDPDTNAFLQDLAHNEKNREWHYDDLPLNCKSYQTCTGFTPENDVVHMMDVCIRTLQGRPSPNYPLSRRNALKLLVHFVGDMHQPLHIGCGFIDVAPDGTIVIVRDPVVIRQRNLAHDRGGNDLVIDNDRKNLHSFWDFTLVENLLTLTGQDITSDTLGEVLRETVRPQPAWNPRGPLDTWAVQWANDSLRISREHVYGGVRIVGKRTIPVLSRGQPVIRDGQQQMQTVYDITRPANYDKTSREVARRQIAKAGYRLAKMLDAIYAQN